MICDIDIWLTEIARYSSFLKWAINQQMDNSSRAVFENFIGLI